MSLSNTLPDLSSTQRSDIPYSKLGDLWTPYKTLQRTVMQYLTGTQLCNDFYDISEFKKQLNLFKQSFMSLLQNPPKSSQHRDDLHRGMEEGINIRGIGHQTLSRELYQEMCILSDMFDLNEYVALDLLCTAQVQMSYYPDLPRGLVAILLYYDGRKTVASMLRMLIQARKGVAWTTKVPREVEDFVTTYTAELASNGLLQRILSLLSSLDLNAEMELLQTNLALGDVKHRSQVMELFETVRLLLADSLFLWSTNCGLSKTITLNLIQHMRQIRLDENPTGTLSHVTLLLEMSLLASFDLSILHTREDGDSIVQTLPILSENDFVESIFNELNNFDIQWTSPGLQGVTLFGFSVTLGALRTIPEGQRLQTIWEHVENLIDKAVGLKAFEFLYNVFLEDIYEEELIHKQLHFLFIDFVILLYNKVKQLRFKADDNARIIANYSQAGLEAPPNLARHFEYLLLAMAKLYEKHSMNVDLVMQYWNQAESTNQYRSGTRDSSLAKFLHLCGDGIPSSIFVPYLTFLRSLSSNQKAARFCFNLMKQSGGQGMGPALTWDHFFMSFAQYYNNLRYEHPPSQDTVYFRRQTSIASYHKGITPQELQGLHAVLKLITTIADQDDFSRLAFCEHPGWTPLTVFLGLVSCAVPPMLKADLLVALAALSKSQETAIQTWNNLEASQILVTVPSTSSFQPRGIQTELDEVESRVEEYPLTRAILHLLSVLVESGIPRTLGAGPRKPGFDPYLTFIINSVFLKFSARSYKDPCEKWKVALKCLDLFNKFLLRYEPAAADFPNNNKQNEFNSPPGFHVMVQMNTKSEFLNTIWLVLEEGIEMHTQYIKAPYQETLKQCTNVCLSILYNALILQTKFFALLNTASCPILLTSLSKLIMTINPRTGRPDYPIIITQYVGYIDVVPMESLTAVRILTYVTNSPLIHTQLMNVLLSCSNLKELRNVFVECLDEREDSGNEYGDGTKVAIFNLARQCLSYPEPNLCHLLFGFDCKKGVSKTVFQLPGVRKFPRTCIHSLFAILQSSVKSPKTMSIDVLEAAYNTLYVLCANTDTSEATLRLLRMQSNFFKEHVPLCFSKVNNGHVELRQMSWLLKTLAIELKVSCATKQLSYLKFLSQLLVGVPVEQRIIHDEFNIGDTFKDFGSKSSMVESMNKSNLLVDLLTTFNFNVKGIVSPEWEYFEKPVLDKLLLSCESQNMIDVKRLHKILVDELCAVQGSTAVGQRQGILTEIQRVLLHALTINQARETTRSVLEFVDAWTQVTEILVLHLPYEILSPKEQQVLEIYLLENILRIIVKNIVNIEVSSLLSGAVLLILVNLRKCHIKEIKQRGLVPDEENNVIKESVIELNRTSMQNILKYLIQWLLSANVASQRLRAHLYTALLTFLRIYDTESDEEEDKTMSADYVRCIDSSRYKIYDQQSSISINQAATANVLGECSDKLVEILCYDCINGKKIIEMLAMSTFSLLISLSNNVKWTTQISSKGYMKFIIEGILSSDKDLRNALEAEPDDLNIHTLYKFESKMKLINRIASTRLGAELLLEQSVLACLSNLKALDLHPQISKHWEKMDGLKIDIPNAEQRYMMLWIPSLQLCDAVLTSLGTDNESAVVQIMYFLFSHLDAVEMILRVGNASLSLESLTELAIMTSLISRSANNDLATLLDSNTVQQNNRAQLYRIQKLMICLLPKFTLSESNIRELLCDTSNISDLNSYQTSSRLYYFMQIGCNLLLYARNVIANNGVEHGTVGVIFQPTLADAVLSAKPQMNRSKFEQTQSLGLIIQMLIADVAFYHKEKATYDFLIRKKNEVPKMGSVELKDFVPMPTEIFDLVYMREDAVALLTEKIVLKRGQMYHTRFQIEHCLYLLWAHLDYYMLKAIPKAKNFGMVGINEQFNTNATLASNTEASWKVTTDDLSALKQDLVSIFNDSFCSQLIETTERSTEADKGLLETLLRKIKRLVQFVPVK